MEKSLILSWNRENIERAPEGCGVFALRTSPVNGDIVFVEETSNLKTALLSMLDEERFQEVKYFDWYQTEDSEEALRIKNELIKRYRLEDILDQDRQ